MAKRKPTRASEPTPQTAPTTEQLDAIDMLEVLDAAAVDVVEVGGMQFRVERIASRDVVYHRVAYVLAATPKAAAGEASAAEELPTDPASVAGQQEVLEGLVCAGVSGVRPIGAKRWTAIAVVMRRSEADPKATPPRVWVGQLSAYVKQLGNAVHDLAMDHGRAAAAVETFLGPSPRGAGA